MLPLDRGRSLTEALHDRSVTFCLGYWRIPENCKRPVEHYSRLFAATCDQLAHGNLLLLHGEDDVADIFRAICADKAIPIRTRRLAIEALPAWPVSERLLAACARMDLRSAPRPKRFRGEKGTVHYWRDYIDGGDSSYRKLISIWMSKIALTQRLAVGENPFGTELFAWVDASIARFAGQRRNWDFSQLRLSRHCISHYGSGMNCHGRRLPLNASLLAGGAAAWSELDALFARELSLCLSEAYAHDEETLLARIVSSHPQLFHCISEPLPPKDGTGGLLHRLAKILR